MGYILFASRIMNYKILNKGATPFVGKLSEFSTGELF